MTSPEPTAESVADAVGRAWKGSDPSPAPAAKAETRAVPVVSNRNLLRDSGAGHDDGEATCSEAFVQSMKYMMTTAARWSQKPIVWTPDGLYVAIPDTFVFEQFWKNNNSGLGGDMFSTFCDFERTLESNGLVKLTREDIHERVPTWTKFDPSFPVPPHVWFNEAVISPSPSVGEARIPTSHSKPVQQISATREVLQEFESTREAARKLDLQHANISHVCNGFRPHTGGFHFRWKNSGADRWASNQKVVNKWRWQVCAVNSRGEYDLNTRVAVLSAVLFKRCGQASKTSTC